MTVPAETPAKPKRGRPKGSETPAVDFSGLSFEEAEPIKRESKSGPNPFLGPLGESYEYDKARVTTLPADAVTRAESMLRRAADELKIGVSIRTDEVKDDEGKPTGNVKLTFQGKERRKRKSKADAAAETPTENAPADANPSTADTAPTDPAAGDAAVSTAGEPVTASA